MYSYQRSIPGIPRYQVLGSDDSGEFSLQISGVSLDDDADYECQVGPGNFNAPIRASAHLYVLCKYWVDHSIFEFIDLSLSMTTFGREKSRDQLIMSKLVV
eukprot:TCALIF_00260-PA protein Name:"Similar to rst Irregular chiasm C-roughest protein (Drosophila melanogaster)" AED:0.48 eAED:0.48 QI:0/0/0/0.5/1/1/2/0/100